MADETGISRFQEPSCKHFQRKCGAPQRREQGLGYRSPHSGSRRVQSNRQSAVRDLLEGYSIRISLVNSYRTHVQWQITGSMFLINARTS
eukprot:6236087-Amphidinium_carterae.3